jgi:hypothetical protein
VFTTSPNHRLDFALHWIGVSILAGDHKRRLIEILMKRIWSLLLLALFSGAPTGNLFGIDVEQDSILLRYQPETTSPIQLSELFDEIDVPIGVIVVRLDLESGTAEAATYLNRWAPDLELKSGDWFYVDSIELFRFPGTEIESGRFELSSPSETLELISQKRTSVGNLPYEGIFDVSPQEGTIVLLEKRSFSTRPYPEPPLDATGNIEMDRPDLIAFVLEEGSWKRVLGQGGSNLTSARIDQLDRVWVYRQENLGSESSINSVRLTIKREGTDLVIDFQGTLLSSQDVEGPYEVIDGAISPFTVPTDKSLRFYLIQ